MKRTLTTAEQTIETAAITAFVADAAKATPAERRQVARSLAQFAKDESEYGERPNFGTHMMSVAGVQEALRQIAAL